MTREKKIKAMRDIMRDLNEVNNNGELQVALVNTRLRVLDSFTMVTISTSGQMYVSGVTPVDEDDWTEPIDSIVNDEDIDILYDGMLRHAEWMKKYGK